MLASDSYIIVGELQLESEIWSIIYSFLHLQSIIQASKMS